MLSLEAACEEADHILHIAKSCPQTVAHPKSSERNGQTFYNIHHKLRQLYEEECVKDSLQPESSIKISSHLIDKLVNRDRLNTLVFNLYPGNKGFSWGIRVPEGEQETVKYPYSQEEMLLCLDREELPYMMLDLLEEKRSDLFYSGCIVAEVRDHRRGFTLNRYTINYVLLRPSTMSLISDLNVLTKNSDFNRDERLQLESQLVLATQGPLCLDPSPAVAISNNRLQYESQPFNTKPLRCTARRMTQVALNRKRKLDQFTAHPELKLHSFLARHTSKAKATTAPVPKKVPIDTTMSVPDVGIEVPRLARAYEKPRETSDCTPHLVEEYILEADRGQGKCYHIKVSILQRASDGQFLGELYVDRDYKEGESNGSACRFPLGTRTHANRYIHQFTEIFTEEGRKSVRITHTKPGQLPRVTVTLGMQEKEARLQAQAQAMLKAQTLVMQPPPSSPLLSPPPQQPSTTPLTNGAASVSPTLSSPKTPVASSPRHMTNPTISAIATSLMNSAQQFQATATANAAATPISMATNTTHLNSMPTIPTHINPMPNNPTNINPMSTNVTHLNSMPAITTQVTSNHSAILSILNSNNHIQPSPQLQQHQHQHQQQHQQQINAQKLLAKKMSITDFLNSGLLHNNQQHVRVSLSSLGQSSTNQMPQFTISTNSAGYATITSGNNVGFTSLPIASKPTNIGFTSIPLTTNPSNNISFTMGQITNPQGSNIGFTNIPISPKQSFTSVPVSQPVNHVKHNARRSSGGDASSNLGLSMPGLSALLAGTPSADNPIPGNSNSSLLDRLTASSATSGSPGYPVASPSPKGQYPPSPVSVSPLSSPPGSGNIRLNCIESLQGAITSIPGLQNVQVTIPGLAVPISVSLNVSSSGGTIVTANQNQNLVLTSTSSGQPVISVPVAQLMASGMKGLNHQNLRSSLPPNASISLPQVGSQAIQLQLQRPRGLMSANHMTVEQRKQAMGRTLIQRPAFRMSSANTVLPGNIIGPANQIVTLTPQQQLQLAAIQKQQLQQLQCLNQPPMTTKHRRRSNAADPNK